MAKFVTTQPEQESASQRVSWLCQPVWLNPATKNTGSLTKLSISRIKKPKTHRYPSLKGTDPKFRRNHRHALHGTMKALKEVKEGKRDAA
ncbi:MAG: hypothetical protein Q9201_002171 [Fulgogasparrea decipioides]